MLGFHSFPNLLCFYPDLAIEDPPDRRRGTQLILPLHVPLKTAQTQIHWRVQRVAEPLLGSHQVMEI